MKTAEISGGRTLAIFRKRRSEIVRNKKVLLLFTVIPLMFILIHQINGPDTTPYSFLLMNMVMPPVNAVAGVFAEEHEKGTLRSLMFAGVRPLEFTAGTAGLFLCVSLFSSSLILIYCEKVAGISIPDNFIIALTAGTVCALLSGCCAGLLAGRQLNVPAVALPFSLLTTMLALLGAGNPGLHGISRLLFSGAVMDVFARGTLPSSVVFVFACNLVILALALIPAWRYAESRG